MCCRCSINAFTLRRLPRRPRRRSSCDDVKKETLEFWKSLRFWMLLDCCRIAFIQRWVGCGCWVSRIVFLPTQLLVHFMFFYRLDGVEFNIFILYLMQFDLYLYLSCVIFVKHFCLFCFIYRSIYISIYLSVIDRQIFVQTKTVCVSLIVGKKYKI